MQICYIFFLSSANSGKYVNFKDEGVYNCIVCGNPLFASETKFDSKSGWPAFHDVLSKDRVILKMDSDQGNLMLTILTLSFLIFMQKLTTVY